MEGPDRNHNVWEDTDIWDEKSGRQVLELSSGTGRHHRDPESQETHNGSCCADPCSVIDTSITGRDEEHLQFAWDSALPCCLGVRQGGRHYKMSHLLFSFI